VSGGSALTGRLVLRDGVRLSLVADLPVAIRSRLDGYDDDVVVARPDARQQVTVVDRRALRLLECFRTPTTLIDAVLTAAPLSGVAPTALLRDAVPLFARLLASGFVGASDASVARPAEPRLRPGARIDDVVVLRCVHYVDDTEVYQGVDDAGARRAVKLAPHADAAAAALRRECQLLRRLDGTVTPRLVADRPWGDGWLAVSEWCAGATLDTAAEGLRRAGPPLGRACALLHLAARVADVVASLHELGVAHGDLHPGNLIVARDGAVHVLDLGNAHDLRGEIPPPSARGIAASWCEPELAEAALDGRDLPPATTAGDQYSVGALVHHVLVGGEYADLGIEERAVLRAVRDLPPAPLAACGLRGSGDVDAMLARAMHKDPARRYPSLRDLAVDLRTAAERRRPPTPPAAVARAARTPAMGDRPTLRWALLRYREALLLDDTERLARAESLVARVLAAGGGRLRVRSTALRVLAHAARGDEAGIATAAAALQHVAGGRRDAGALVACALVHESARRARLPHDVVAQLTACGDRIAARRLRAPSGVAALYAKLLWAARSGRQPTVAVQAAAARLAVARTARSVTADTVHALLLWHRQAADDAALARALGIARELPRIGSRPADVFALLACYRCTGDAAWVRRAHAITGCVVRDPRIGAATRALVALEVMHPDWARAPLWECDDQWPATPVVGPGA